MLGPWPSEKNPLVTKVMLFLAKHKIPILHRLCGIILGCDIFCEIPDGLLMAHPYGIMIHRNAILGNNILISHQVTIGSRGSTSLAPVIEDGVLIGAGAKILGYVRIGKGAKIGANAVVTKDVPGGATVIGCNEIRSGGRSSVHSVIK